MLYIGLNYVISHIKLFHSSTKDHEENPTFLSIVYRRDLMRIHYLSTSSLDCYHRVNIITGSLTLASLQILVKLTPR